MCKHGLAVLAIGRDVCFLDGTFDKLQTCTRKNYPFGNSDSGSAYPGHKNSHISATERVFTSNLLQRCCIYEIQC